MKDSFLGRQTAVPSEANIPFETAALAESSAALHHTVLPELESALPLAEHQGRPAPHPSKEGSVQLIWEIHRVLLQEAGRGKAAPLGPPQGAVLHRAALQRGQRHGGTARNLNPSSQTHPSQRTASPSAEVGSCLWMEHSRGDV